MKMTIAAMFVCAASIAHADITEYQLSGGTVASVVTTGVFADGEITAVFPGQPDFTLNSATLSGSVSQGIGHYTESFGPIPGYSTPYLTQTYGSAGFTVDYRGATPVVTSFEASTPQGYPSGDLHGVAWSWSFVKNASGSVLDIFELYTAYGSSAVGTALETIDNVTISKVGVMAPEMDASSAASAITLLCGGLLVVLSRKRR
jgi:hypothetical protein